MDELLRAEIKIMNERLERINAIVNDVRGDVKLLNWKRELDRKIFWGIITEFLILAFFTLIVAAIRFWK